MFTEWWVSQEHSPESRQMTAPQIHAAWVLELQEVPLKSGDLFPQVLSSSTQVTVQILNVYTPLVDEKNSVFRVNDTRNYKVYILGDCS